MPSPSDTQEPLNERHDLETDSSLRSMSTGAEFAKDSPVTKPFHATFGHHAPPAARDFANDNESIPSGDIEQTSHRSASPTIFNSRVHDGRSTPAPSQFHNGHYQHSATETSSYFTRTDVEGGLPVGSARGYVAVDPFVPSVAQSIANFAYPSDPWFSQPYLRQSTPAPPLSYHLTETHAFEIPTSKFILAFVLDTLPRQIYLHFLLTLPSLYFSRVARIFEEAELSMPYIKKLVMVSGGQWKDQSASAINANLNVAPSINSPHFSHLKASWEHFIDSLTKEWKTLNIVSVLLLS
ncbi:hypothetical protein H0H87_007817 [Tephrocybe sp. NHM501043]|nr:hypothetical protein H0H87_007817 [Tephrocybe sp. NHM501043]